MNTIKLLRTIQPVDGVVLLPITPAEAEYQWFNEVSYNDRKDFELLVEPHGAGSCMVSVRLWSDSDFIASGGPNWFAWLMFGSILVGLLLAVCQKFGYEFSVLIAQYL